MIPTTTLFLSTAFEAKPSGIGHRAARLPVPTRCPPPSSTPCWAVFELNGDVPRIGTDRAEVERFLDEVWNPTWVLYFGIQEETRIDPLDMNEKAAKHFQIADPPEAKNGRYMVGHFSDPPPNGLSRDQIEILRNRVLAALDLLVPLFLSVDPNMTWPDEANRALREIRDFFPLVAEPGLWPFYHAEGREFFRWVWERVSCEHQALFPWESR